MKIFRIFMHCIRDAFKSVFRNISLSLASISCIAITLVIVAIAIIASYNVENFTKEIEKDITIVVFVENDATQEDEEKITDKIKSMNNVASYKFISKIDASEDMSNSSDVLKNVLSGFKEEDNPLKDSYKVKVKNVEKIGQTAEKIKKLEKIYSVQYGAGMVDQMVIAFDTIEKGMYVAVIALFIVSIFLIVNTIKLTISARKREISIMRLVGASNFAIKTPFIIEGMILGLLGSILPIVMVIYAYPKIYTHFNGHLFTQLIQLVEPKPFIYEISLIILVIGILVGMVGSASASRKYLKI